MLNTIIKQIENMDTNEFTIFTVITGLVFILSLVIISCTICSVIGSICHIFV